MKNCSAPNLMLRTLPSCISCQGLQVIEQPAHCRAHHVCCSCLICVPCCERIEWLFSVQGLQGVVIRTLE